MHVYICHACMNWSIFSGQSSSSSFFSVAAVCGGLGFPLYDDVIASINALLMNVWVLTA